MSDLLTRDSDNDTQCELAAWELLKEAREERDRAQALARELRDALSRLRSQMQIADNDHELTVRVFQIPSGEVRRADLFLTRAKEVLL